MTISAAVHRLGCFTLAILAALSLVPTQFGASPADAAEPTFVFSGGGWGHAVGMSQYGALGRAEAGHGYRNILTSYYRDTKVKTGTVSNNIRVHLSDSTSVQITPSAPVRIFVNNKAAGTSKIAVPFTVNYTGNKISVVAPSIGCTGGACVGGGAYIPLKVGNPVGLSSTGHRYQRGQLRFSPNGSTMRVSVSKLTMQAYLYGIAEVPNSWPTQALRAQAVAARSFAEDRTRARRASGAGYDLLATTSDQAYSGYEKESASQASRWVAGVDATVDQMIHYKGVPIGALYSSSNGGYSADSGYVFVTSLPYFKATPDPFDKTPTNPNHRWTRSFTKAQISAALARYSDTSVGTVKSIRILGGVAVSGHVDKADVRIVGSDRSVVIDGARLRSVINAGSDSAHQLLSSKFVVVGSGPPNATPFGSLDEVKQIKGRVRVAGWAIDRDRPSTALRVRVIVDGKRRVTLIADKKRSDIAQRYQLGANHGFSTLLTMGTGGHRVCATALNVGQFGRNKLLGCRSITVTDQVPFGNLERVTVGDERATLRGWAIDPDRPAVATGVHVYVNGKFNVGGTAGLYRPDVADAHHRGPNHGFRIKTSRLAVGTHTVCAYALNAGPGKTNAGLGCRRVTVTDSVPFGNLEGMHRSGPKVRVRGWAIDADRPGKSVPIHVYINGRLVKTARAELARPDVARAHGLGENHGFNFVTPPVGAGIKNVCAYAINLGPGSVNSNLGCRQIVF